MRIDPIFVKNYLFRTYASVPTTYQYLKVDTAGTDNRFDFFLKVLKEILIKKINSYQ